MPITPTEAARLTLSESEKVKSYIAQINNQLKGKYLGLEKQLVIDVKPKPSERIEEYLKYVYDRAGWKIDAGFRITSEGQCFYFRAKQNIPLHRTKEELVDEGICERDDLEIYLPDIGDNNDLAGDKDGLIGKDTD